MLQLSKMRGMPSSSLTWGDKFSRMLKNGQTEKSVSTFHVWYHWTFSSCFDNLIPVLKQYFRSLFKQSVQKSRICSQGARFWCWKHFGFRLLFACIDPLCLSGKQRALTKMQSRNTSAIIWLSLVFFFFFNKSEFICRLVIHLSTQNPFSHLKLLFGM